MSRLAALAFILWAAYGLRALLLKEHLPDTNPVPLRIPLSEFPREALGSDWTGWDVPLDENVEKRARVSAYLQREYKSRGSTLWFYVGYVAKWSPGSIHHPSICFPGSGFELEDTATVVVAVPGMQEEALFTEYLWRTPQGGGTYTLSSFYYNGKFQPEEWRLRMDSLSGIRYFAIVTLSGSLASSMEETRELYQGALQQALPVLLRHFET